MSTHPPPLPLKPRYPEPGECCGGGCVRCVYDLYDEALERWREAAQRAGVDPDTVADP